MRCCGRCCSFAISALLLFVVTGCSPVTTNAVRPAPCANPVIVVQNNTPYRADIWQYQNYQPTFIASVAALNKQTITVEGKSGFYYATRENGTRFSARDAVRIDRNCTE
jgi:hypothetical protein